MVFLLFGFFVYDGMFIIFCSMKIFVVVRIGFGDEFILRLVDVCLKEGRKFMLVVWEIFFNDIYLENMLIIFLF